MLKILWGSFGILGLPLAWRFTGIEMWQTGVAMVFNRLGGEISMEMGHHQRFAQAIWHSFRPKAWVIGC